MTKRPGWDEYHMRQAAAAATRTTCPRAREAAPPDGVGVVLVRQNRVLATGYCGSVRGLPHCDDVGCDVGPGGGCERTVHAEVNALLQAAQHGVSVEGSTLYSTLSPCWTCFKAVANVGVVRVVFASEYRDVARQLEASARLGISWERLNNE